LEKGGGKKEKIQKQKTKKKSRNNQAKGRPKKRYGFLKEAIKNRNAKRKKNTWKTKERVGFGGAGVH